MIKVKNRKLLLLPGDGIGPEVICEVKKIIEWFNKNKSLDFKIEELTQVALASRSAVLVRRSVAGARPARAPPGHSRARGGARRQHAGGDVLRSVARRRTVVPRRGPALRLARNPLGQLRRHDFVRSPKTPQGRGCAHGNQRVRAVDGVHDR